MAITVKHSKVSTIPDDADTSLVRPSDWNDDHVLTGTVPVANGGTGASTLTGYVKGNGTAAMTAASTIPNTDVTGLGTMSTQNSNNISVTGGSMSGVTISDYVATATKGVANGVASLDGSGTVPISQLPAAVLGALSYQGTWNASTNTPTLTSSVGTKGYYYVVNVAGSTNLNGITDWVVGDWAVFNGSVWQKVDNTDAVTSVNGYTGTVVLTTTDVAEGTNQYFTTARARTSVSAGTGISYNSTTGVITNSSPSLGGDVVGPASATDNAIARYDTTTGKLIQNSAVTISDAGDMAGAGSLAFDGTNPTSPAAGTIWFESSTNTWNAQQNAITQQIGEELFVYGKASAAITDSPLQIIYHTGTVGASGVITFAPTIAGITDENAIVGVATENIALNGFGRVTAFGVVHGITTNGAAFGETWADDDVIWYNPVTGNPTKVKPVAPNIKFQIGTVINAGSGGSGSFQVNLVQGTALGGTDSNVQVTSVANGNLLTYDGGNGYWKNTDLTAGTGISVSKSTNGVLTITNTSPSSGGTVTSVAALTLGTTGTDLSSTVANGTTTPVITLQVPTASATNRGALSAADWTTFNNKGTGTVTSVAATVPSVLSITGSPITSSGTLAIGYSGTALPVANGGTGATTIAEAFSDLTPLTLTTASATPLVLTNTSGYQQQIIGSTNQTITLPSTATLAVGWSFLITNGTGFTVTVNTSTGANVYANSNIGSYRVWCISTANNNAASWSSGAETFSFETGSGSVVRATSPTIASATLTSPTATGALAFTGTTSQAAQFATSQTTGNTTITTAQTSGTLTIGGASGTGIQTIGQSTVSQTTNIQAGATASGSTKTMNIGTGGLTGSTTAIAIGSSIGTTTTVNGVFTTPVPQASNGIVCNNRTIGTTFSIPAGYSATSAGPITISSGVSVTVPTGGKWVVL
jgi:hypothetical protein